MIKFWKSVFMVAFLVSLSAGCIGCSNSSDDDDSTTTEYEGAYTIGGTSYETLTVSGTSASGSATFKGDSGTRSGSYASGKASFALSGSYVITFSDGKIALTVSNASDSSEAVISNGSLSATGTGYSGNEHWTSNSQWSNVNSGL